MRYLMAVANIKFFQHRTPFGHLNQSSIRDTLTAFD
ncbi:hypothetical protein BVRB_5g105580 [Beta vulgaris subsp. vulgaris]|nr:hypothetical protein BVRB_5g105580 [Beta vulgaris subsp. vulgaris]